MGLREKKAQKVREAIHEAMLTLVECGGYEAATLEQVAERAEVGISTVYRHFANKDAILLDPFERKFGELADQLRARPDGEDVAVSLGEIVHSAVDLDRDALDHLYRLRAVVDLAEGSRARLWDFLNRLRVLLVDAIAERSGRDPLWNEAAAHITIMIFSMALENGRNGRDETSPAEYADRIIATLHDARAPLPARA